MSESPWRTNEGLAGFRRYGHTYFVGAEFPGFDREGPFVLAVLIAEHSPRPTILAEYRYRNGDLLTMWADHDQVFFPPNQRAVDLGEIVRAVAAAVGGAAPAVPALGLQWNTDAILSVPRLDGAAGVDVITFAPDGPRWTQGAPGAAT